LLRARESYEFNDIGLRQLDPDARIYHMIEQVFELPLWSIRALPALSANGDPSEARDRTWVRLLTASTEALLSIIRAPGWENIEVHVLLPAYMTAHGTMELARCNAIWHAYVASEPEQRTWVFETDKGSYADPEYGIQLEEVCKVGMLWGSPGAPREAADFHT
jgi:hypothetical protein